VVIVHNFYADSPVKFDAAANVATFYPACPASQAFLPGLPKKSSVILLRK